MAKTAEIDPSQEETASPDGHEQIDWLDSQDEQQLRQFILQANDRPGELVEVREWRVKLLVRAMSGSQRALYEAMPRDTKTGRFRDLRHVYFEVMRMCCVHPRTHKPVFQAADKDTVMDEKNGTVVDLLVGKALRLSGLLPSQVERTRKNSENTPTSTTTTDSENDSATEAE